MTRAQAKTAQAIRESGFLNRNGLWGLVDGQYGSTGKGLAASLLAEVLGTKVNAVVSNAGPNSGHTSYGPSGEKVVLQQLPTFAVSSMLFHGHAPSTVYMDAGAIIDIDKFNEEVRQWLDSGGHKWVSVDPQAAIVTPEALKLEADLVGKIGSTGKGTGGALARKVLRFPDAVASEHKDAISGRIEKLHFGRDEIVFMEVSQGYSLSLNASGMYPYTTSRDCTIGQAMADAGIHPSWFHGAMMVVRTFPIRVAGNSGPSYPDQEETSWEVLGVTPEITTVTKKVRRVFTWSDIQFKQAVAANRPCSLMINFIQYLKPDEREPFIRKVIEMYKEIMGWLPRLVLVGHGPCNSDVESYKV